MSAETANRPEALFHQVLLEKQQQDYDDEIGNYTVSEILDDGTYKPGFQHALRKAVNTDHFLASRQILFAFKQHRASCLFAEKNFLGFKDFLNDGFRLIDKYECLLVDERIDPVLRTFGRSIGDRLEHMRGSSEQQRVLFVAQCVSEALGGSAVADAGVDERFRALGGKLGQDFPIGNLLGGALAGSNRQGVGYCRHRATLMKYLCDSFGIAECALVSGVTCDVGFRGPLGTDGITDGHIWNLVRIRLRTYLLDVMWDPGKLSDCGTGVCGGDLL